MGRKNNRAVIADYPSVEEAIMAELDRESALADIADGTSPTDIDAYWQ